MRCTPHRRSLPQSFAPPRAQGFHAAVLLPGPPMRDQPAPPAGNLPGTQTLPTSPAGVPTLSRSGVCGQRLGETHTTRSSSSQVPYHEIVSWGCIILPRTPPAPVLPGCIRTRFPLHLLSLLCLMHPRVLLLLPLSSTWLQWCSTSSFLRNLCLCHYVHHRASPDLRKGVGMAPDERLTEGTRQHSLLKRMHQHILVLAAVSYTHLTLPTNREV